MSPFTWILGVTLFAAPFPVFQGMGPRGGMPSFGQARQPSMQPMHMMQMHRNMMPGPFGMGGMQRHGMPMTMNMQGMQGMNMMHHRHCMHPLYGMPMQGMSMQGMSMGGMKGTMGPHFWGGRSPMKGTPLTGDMQAKKGPPTWGGMTPTGMQAKKGPPSWGGMTPTGGTPPMGGMQAKKGPPTWGGMTPTGGTPPMGGMQAKKGPPTWGGMTPTGGTPPMGGMQAKKGPPTWGGMTPTGGTPPMGGIQAKKGPPIGGMAAMTGSPQKGGMQAKKGSGAGTMHMHNVHKMGMHQHCFLMDGQKKWGEPKGMRMGAMEMHRTHMQDGFKGKWGMAGEPGRHKDKLPPDQAKGRTDKGPHRWFHHGFHPGPWKEFPFWADRCAGMAAIPYALLAPVPGNIYSGGAVPYYPSYATNVGAPTPYAAPFYDTAGYGGAGYGGSGAYPQQVAPPVQAPPQPPVQRPSDLETLLTAFGVPNEDGRLRWPLAFRLLGPGLGRELMPQIDGLFVVLARQAAGGGVTPGVVQQAWRQLDQLEQALRLRQESMAEATYRDGLVFVANLRRALSAMSGEPAPGAVAQAPRKGETPPFTYAP